MAAVAADVAAVMQRVASTGYVRNKLTVLQGGAAGGAIDAATAMSPSPWARR